MLHTVENHDISETLSLQDNGELEDSIYLAVDKLEALCTVQARLEAGDAQVEPSTRMHYTMVVEEQLRELRQLLNQHFG